MKIGDAVRVHLGGQNGDGSICQGEVTAIRNVGPTPIHVNFAMWSGEFPKSWVTPVVPPCPWTEIGTTVACGSDSFPDIYRLNASGWYELGNGVQQADYATDIAPRNPVELVPLQTPVKYDANRHGWMWRVETPEGRVTHTLFGTEDAILSLRSGEAVKA